MTREQEERAPCEDVAERVALGEPLGDLEGHAASCGECRSITETAGKLAVAHSQIDPGLGFSARMTIGAQQRIAVRRRRRMAGSLAGLTMVGALGVFVITRSPKEQPEGNTVGQFEGPKPLLENDNPQPIADEDVKMLIDLADTRRASRSSAPWGRIEKPLRPYMKLVRNTHEAPVLMAVPPHAPTSSTPGDTEDMP